MFVKFGLCGKNPKGDVEEGNRASAFKHGCLEGNTGLKRLTGLGKTGGSRAVSSTQVCNVN